MEITVKCPNCFHQVPRNPYCSNCGSKLDFTVPISEIPDRSAESYTPKYCPYGHRVKNSSLGFCDVCGAALVHEPAEGMLRKSKPEEEMDRIEWQTIAKKCPNGHVFEDLKLVFCPECGMRFSTALKKGEKKRESIPENSVIADGMYMPTDADLAKKARRR